jgi:hypothetical protein
MPYDSSILKDFALIFPDSLVCGSFVFALITLSSVHGLLFISIIESLIALYGLQGIFSFLVGKSSVPKECISKFHSIVFQDIFSGVTTNNPSYAIFVVSVVCSYLLTSLMYFKEELDVLDPSFSQQYNVTFVALGLLPLFYAIFRMFSSCDTVSGTFFGIVFGYLIGYLLSYQNSQLFGIDSLNFLGIPILRNKTVDNQPIYICA